MQHPPNASQRILDFNQHLVEHSAFGITHFNNTQIYKEE